MKIVFASNNKNKFDELNAFMKKNIQNKSSFKLIFQADLNIPEIEETGLTFVENALLKARHVARLTKLPTIADDSGLVVTALNGAPGIYSSRYAGNAARAKDNIKKLLAELKNVPVQNRKAYFYCILVYLIHEKDPTPLICEGKWEGKISSQAKGQHGFGYDPVFYIPSKKKTAAELPLVLKNKISHRGMALQLLIKKLSDQL